MSAPPSLADPVAQDANPADEPLDEVLPERPDPARTVVAIGAVPPLTEPVRPARRVLPPPPTDRARGWAVTGILTFVAALVRLVNLGSATDGGTPLFDETVYFLAKMPATIDPAEVIGVVVMALTLSFLATIYPSWRAARLDPVEALRYE